MTTGRIAQNMEVIRADGVHVGTVDGIANGRIRLAKRDSGEGQHKGHAHFIDLGLVADVEGQRVRLLLTRRGCDVRGRAVGKARLTMEGPTNLVTRKAWKSATRQQDSGFARLPHAKGLRRHERKKPWRRS